MKAGESSNRKWLVRIAFLIAAAVIWFLIPEVNGEGVVSASFNSTLLVGRSDTDRVNNDDREVAYVVLMDYMEQLRTVYDLSPEGEERMNEVFYQANVYIANTEMTVGQLVAYVNTVESNLATAAQTNISSANQFLFLSNDIQVTTASYGEVAVVSLSVINLGQADLENIVITPTTSTDITKWPFVIMNPSDAKMIPILQAASSIEDAEAKRMEISWAFVVADNAKTGTYILPFHAIYYRNGKVEEADLKTFINIQGKPSSGLLNGEEEKKDEEETRTSTPRIVVTGFRTDPEVVFAGDTFHLTITVQNTSSSTAVSNIQFDLKAAQEGHNNETTYEAFLPTSGSATIYVNRIAAGETTEIDIEMTARADLTQKPYVVTVNAAYEDNKKNPYTATTNVSIPVHQEARVDTGEAEILPESINVGSSANVMFQIYNMGKTTLYNVQVAFEGDSISGGSTFVGKLEPGATGNVDTMVNGAAPTMDDGTIIAVISYEDDAGNVTTLEKELTLYVMEEYYDDFDYGDFDYGDYEMEEEKPPFPWMWVGIGAGALVLVIIIIAVIVGNHKKKKALLKELEEDDN